MKPTPTEKLSPDAVRWAKEFGALLWLEVTHPLPPIPTGAIIWKKKRRRTPKPEATV